MMTKLQINSLCKSYRSRQVVKGVSLDISSGEIIGLLGPNGAGKTTTFYMTVGLVTPDSGSIQIDNEDITKLPMYKRANKGIGYLPQERSIFRKMTVTENILAILELRKDLNKKQRQEKLNSLLDDFNIQHIKNSDAISLSGGECRRVEIARALALNPRFILLDEPFAGIDPITITEIKNIIKSLAQKNIGILITDHNVRETLKICDRAYIVYDGNIITSGPAENIVNNDTVKKVYLGEEFSIE